MTVPAVPAHPDTAQPGRHADRIEQIMGYMRDTLDNPRSLTFYARRCSLCVSRFSEAFREHCVVRPIVYLTFNDPNFHKRKMTLMELYILPLPGS